MHFKLDENIPVSLKTILISLEHEASTVYDENLSGKKDGELLDICLKNKFVFVTLDNDFSNIISYPPRLNSGIIVIKTQKQGSDSVVNLFKKLIEAVDINDVKGSTIIVEEHKVRIRK